MGKIIKFIRFCAVIPIILYQKTFSFDHGPLKVFFPNGYCRFYPTCSQYSRLAIEKHGIFKGMVKGVWRILRCNPWNKGGIDHP